MTIDRATHERWLLEITSLPTAAGKEQRVIKWIERWVADRPDLSLTTDPAGNLVIERRSAPANTPPIFVTAHLDHPAFVIEGFVGPGTVHLSFRGGVNTPYFNRAPIVLLTADDQPVKATITSTQAKEPWRECIAEIENSADARKLAVGDVGRWDLSEPCIKDGNIYTHACDDLAALAAALAAMDVLRSVPDAAHVKLLFTRAEEVGFVGAIAACKHKTMPEGSRVIALENSRSFPNDSPIGAGPIIRVGDRISTFSPALTGACAKLAENIAKEREKSDNPFRWQRKLMPGGACEASAYQAYGYEATCICLPLGNYHNMADLERVQANVPEAIDAARCGPEFVSVADFHGMVDLLVAAGTGLSGAEPIIQRMEKLYAERGHVLTS